MKTLSKSLIFVLVVSFFVGFTGSALAYNPSLSVYSSGSGDTTISISGGQPNATVVINYTPSGSNLSASVTGVTDYSGNFTTMVNSANSSQINATVGGQQVYANNNGYNGGGYNTGGCTYYGCNNVGGLTLSQTSLSLNAGQTSYVTATYPVYGYNNNVYVSSNSNSSVASASVSGNQITVYGSTSGSTTISVCANSSSSCASLYVTVSGNNNGCGYYGCSVGGLTLSQTSVSLSVGQTTTVTASMASYNPSFYVSSNSNSGAVSAYMNGNSLTLNGLAAGNSTVSICVSGGSTCASVHVTVSGVLGANTNLWFSPASPTMYVGQSLAVSINSSAYSTSYPYNSSAYNISSNSNSNAVSANISGTVLNLYANQNGSSNISVCSSALGFCGTLYVTVGGGSSNNYGGSLSLSQTSLSLSQGQSMIVSAYNVPSVYVSSNSNPGIVSASVTVNQVTFYGQASGSSTVVLCGINSGQCGTVYVTVNGYGNNYGNIVLSQTTLGLNVGQSATVNVSGNGGYGYYISQNSNPGVVSAVFNGSVITVYGIASGSSTLQICQNSANSCQSLHVTVGGNFYNNGYPYNNGNGLQYSGGGVLGASTYLNGQLISEGSTVYIVYKNTQTAFASASAFLGLGFKFNNVLQVGNSGLASSGYTVTTSFAQHPWGSWVKSGSTVYFVHQSGLIPVPDWNTFLNNGGQAGLIVPANIYDFRLPMLSSMTSGDSRLQ